MKNHSMFSRYLCLLFICSLGTGNANAQPSITSANLSDNATCSGYSFINTANIDYTPNCNSCSTTEQLKVMVTDGYYVQITDGVNTPYCFQGTGITPDVVIGNANSPYSTSDYLIGIVYAGYPQSPCTINSAYQADIWLDVYDVSNVGQPGGLTVSGPVSTLISKVVTLPTPREFQTSNVFPHIDIIADYNTSGPGNMPMCDEFVISWTDSYNGLLSALTCSPFAPGNVNTNYGVNLYWSSLSNPAPPSTSNSFNYNTGGVDPWAADVAAVRTMVASSYDAVAYIAYSDYNNNDLYVNECNLSTGTFSTPTGLGNAKGPYPRIDAIDNVAYNDNSVGGGTYNVWMLVDEDIYPSPNVVEGWYSVAGSITGPVTMGGWSSPPTNDGGPVVTCGPGQTYTVAYTHLDGFDSYVSTSFNWAGSLSTPTNYYRINKTTNAQNFNGISSTCNNDGTFSFGNSPWLYAAWEDSYGYDYDKETYDVQHWKHANTGQNTVKTKARDWSVSPNPATDHLILSGYRGYGAANYKIFDITGRELINSIVNSDAQRIDINLLANGMYVLHVFEGEKELKTTRFVKN